MNFVEQDICYLYHELSEYGSIMEDLDYAGTYSRPYWNYLNLPLAQDANHFVRDGCLILILCMARDLIEGQANQLAASIETCRSQIDTIAPDSERTLKVIDIVRKAVVCAESECKPNSVMDEEVQWAYDTVVAQYFRDRSQPNRPEM